jgi:hypothetical protein
MECLAPMHARLMAQRRPCVIPWWPRRECRTHQRGSQGAANRSTEILLRRSSVNRDHDVGGLDHDDDAVIGLDAEIVDGLVGDRGSQDVAADIDADMRSGCTLLTSTTMPLMWLRALKRICVPSALVIGLSTIDAWRWFAEQ